MTVRVSIEGKRGCGFRSEGGLYLIGGKLAAPCCRFPIPLNRCPACDSGIKPSRGWTWINASQLIDGVPNHAALSEALEDIVAGRCDPQQRARTVLEAEVARVPPCVADPALWRTAAGARRCPLATIAKDERAGLIWIGERYYATPADFLREAQEMGISRKIPQLPKGFVSGETRVYLAHRKVIEVEPPALNLTHPILTEDAAAEIEAQADEDGTMWQPGIFASFVPERVEQVVNRDVTDEEVERIEKRGIEPVIVVRDEPTQGSLIDGEDEGED